MTALRRNVTGPAVIVTARGARFDGAGDSLAALPTTNEA
jgi:hypothetical protein